MIDPNALLNAKQLAQALGRASNFVTAMKRAGYKFQYPGLGKTTLAHALEALKNEDFVPSHYMCKEWMRLPRVLADPNDAKK